MSEEVNTRWATRALEVIAERRYVACEDLMQITSAGIPIYQRLADSLGVEPKAVRDLAERRDLDSAMVQRIVREYLDAAA